MDTLYVVSVGNESVHMTTDEGEAMKVFDSYNKALKAVKAWHNATLKRCELPKDLTSKKPQTSGIMPDPWD